MSMRHHTDIHAMRRSMMYSDRRPKGTTSGPPKDLGDAHTIVPREGKGSRLKGTLVLSIIVMTISVVVASFVAVADASSLWSNVIDKTHPSEVAADPAPSCHGPRADREPRRTGCTQREIVKVFLDSSNKTRSEHFLLFCEEFYLSTFAVDESGNRSLFLHLAQSDDGLKRVFQASFSFKIFPTVLKGSPKLTSNSTTHKYSTGWGYPPSKFISAAEAKNYTTKDKAWFVEVVMESPPLIQVGQAQDVSVPLSSSNRTTSQHFEMYGEQWYLSTELHDDGYRSLFLHSPGPERDGPIFSLATGPWHRLFTDAKPNTKWGSAQFVSKEEAQKHNVEEEKVWHVAVFIDEGQ